MATSKSYSYLFNDEIGERTMLGITRKIVKQVRKTQNKDNLRFIGYDVDMCPMFEANEEGHDALLAIATPYKVQTYRLGPPAEKERNRPEIIRRRM